MEDYSKKRNKLSTQAVINRNIIPLLGRKKVQDVNRPDIAGLMERLSYKQTEAHKVFSVLRKMFNMAEVWGYRSDGTNPCRQAPMFPAGKSTHLISDEEMGDSFRQLDKIEPEGLENYVIPLGIRLQFEFLAAARKSSRWNGTGLTCRTAASSGLTARPAACPYRGQTGARRGRTGSESAQDDHLDATSQGDGGMSRRKASIAAFNAELTLLF
ncbi:Integrase [Pseudomonas chlororaphis subsp. aurantiaca]|nr:Integrase [Pseudomonas chlororaphis subsp. aurantiaca]